MIGLGNMGLPMCHNLLKAGHSLHVFDRQAEAMKQAMEWGAKSSGSTPGQVAARAQIVVTMLPSSAHVEDVYAGDQGVLDHVAKDTLLIDSSTIDPQTSSRMAQLADERAAAKFVDAPVSGGVGGAQQGTLTFMVGGPTSSFARAEPILSLMGKRLVHCGELVGSGQAAKIVNNAVLAASMVAVSEAFVVGQRLGVDKHVLADIINTSSGRCWASDTYNPVPGVMEGVPSNNDYQGGFGSALMKKDLGLAIQAATGVQASVPLMNNTHALYSLITEHGHGRKDFSYVYQFLQGSEKPPAS